MGVKITKALLGKYVEVAWRDPIGVQRAPIEQAPKGLAGLAMWKERGVVDDITEEVVRIIHSSGHEPGSSNADEISFTLVPEDLIIDVVVFEPVGKEAV